MHWILNGNEKSEACYVWFAPVRTQNNECSRYSCALSTTVLCTVPFLYPQWAKTCNKIPLGSGPRYAAGYSSIFPPNWVRQYTEECWALIRPAF